MTKPARRRPSIDVPLLRGGLRRAAWIARGRSRGAADPRVRCAKRINMKVARLLPVALLLAGACGKQYVGNALVMHYIDLSAQHPTNGDWNMRLIAVEEDGTVVIQRTVVSQRRVEELRLAPRGGDGFDVPEVVSSDFAKQRARLGVLVCESINGRLY